MVQIAVDGIGRMEGGKVKLSIVCVDGEITCDINEGSLISTRKTRARLDKGDKNIEG